MNAKKKHSTWILILGIALLILSACNKAPKGNPENGERWYRLNRCNGCHGENGVGGKGIGAKGPPLASTSLSQGQFMRKLRNPDSGIMPPYETDRLPDQDVADIHSWLKQL